MRKKSHVPDNQHVAVLDDVNPCGRRDLWRSTFLEIAVNRVRGLHPVTSYFASPFNRLRRSARSAALHWARERFSSWPGNVAFGVMLNFRSRPSTAEELR